MLINQIREPVAQLVEHSTFNRFLGVFGLPTIVVDKSSFSTENAYE